MNALEANVPTIVASMWTPRQWRQVIRMGMKFRRSRRFSLVCRCVDDGEGFHLVDAARWIDIGGEG